MDAPARKTTDDLPKDRRANLRVGGGRPKGIPNKMTGKVKEMILAALDQAGGVTYLAEQAEKNPGPFMALVGKVLPMQVAGEDGGALTVQIVRLADADN